MRLLKIFLILSLGILIVIGLLFIAWASTVPDPMPEALASMGSIDTVRVENEEYLCFHPAGGRPSTGVIIYPGAKVDPRSYAPLARNIAEEGFFVAVPSMPLNLALFAPDRAGELIKKYPDIKTWIVAGHSLGGTIAADFAARNRGTVSGLILLASYPLSISNLQNGDLPVISIYGSSDGVATKEEVLAGAANLPTSTKWIEIDGGNHSQFGWYGDQSGDRPASISRQEQQRQIEESIVGFLREIEGRR